MNEKCIYRQSERCNHPKVNDSPQFPLDKNEECGDCLYRIEIQRHNMTTKAGNTLSFFYNPENDLLVVDLIHKNEKAGNEFVRMTLDEKKLLGHT